MIDDGVLLASVAGVVASQSVVRPYGDAQLISLPLRYGDGTSVVLEVSELGRGLVSVSDRGRTADLLAEAGVDLSRKHVSRSWDAVRASVGIPEMLATEESELSAVVDVGALGSAVFEVGAACLRGDGLRVLGQGFRPTSFADRVISKIADRQLTVVPHAPLQTRHGGRRKVTCRVDTRNRSVFIQALAGGSSDKRTGSFDHAVSVFASADAGREEMSAYLEGTSDSWERWQKASLADYANIGFEADDDLFFDQLERQGLLPSV